MSAIEVASLEFFPIKSCSGIEADDVTVSEFGIQYDREWMLVGQKGNFLSQRTHPELALVQTQMQADGLVVSAPNIGRFAVSLERDPDAPRVPVTLWKKPGVGTDQGQEANDFFSTYLGRDARLLRVEQPRDIKPECRVESAAERTAFADGFPFLLASNDSLAELNEHLDEPIAINRFRPNIIVEGAPAYDEDYWRAIQIGTLQAFVVRACARCPIPNIDQTVGQLPKERLVTEALRATRQGFDHAGGQKGEFFGQNVVHVFEPGTVLRVGDKVEVLSRSEGRNFDRYTA